MDSYSNKLLLSIPVVDVLTYFGKRADHRSYMYYSPFRDESKPSMRVTVNKADGTWIWADYGGSPAGGRKVDGGGALDLVRRLAGVSTDAEAYSILEDIGSKRGIEVIRDEVRRNRRDAKETGIVIDDVSEVFTRKSILNYITNVRCIPMSLVEKYCRQVTYHTRSDSSRSYTVIGFANNAGGYAMRGSGEGRKLNNVWGLTTLGSDGMIRPDESVTNGKCAVFEGFMDFLSYMAWRGVNEPGMDMCVLHSASNAVHARRWLLEHESVRCFFDNDNAGSRATDLVRGWCGENGVDFKDGRTAYVGFKDINDAWKNVVAERKAKSMSPFCNDSTFGVKIR